MSELRVPHPRTQRGGVRGATVVLLLVAMMWVVEVADFLLPGTADGNGILPRRLAGLDGVLWAPFLHADFAHLSANTLPLVVLGLLAAWRAGPAIWRILLVIVVVGGLGVWLFAPSYVITIGASGLVFGLLGYLLAAGIISRRFVDITVGVGVLVIYGSTLWAATPFGVDPGVSWLAHLSGFGAGVLAAARYAPRPTTAR